MLEGVLYFGLGFLGAILLALMILPAVWNRAVILTTRRIEKSVPLTLNEIQSDKDQMRAEFAVSTRRLEMSVDELREKSARQLIDIARKRDELAKLAEESAERIRAIEEQESRSSDLRGQLRDREERLANAQRGIEEVNAQTEEKALELEKMRSRLFHAESEVDSRRIEMIAKQTAMENLSDKVGDYDRRESAVKGELETLRDEVRKAETALKVEKRRAAGLDSRLEKAQTRSAELEERLEKRDREVSRLREVSSSVEAGEAELSAKLIEEKSRCVELEAKLASSALQMEALLNDASNDNVEKAMAALNRDREKTESSLAEITLERDRLRDDLQSRERAGGQDWEVERRENAILRERINDLAAQVTSMVAALEGEGSQIDKVLTAHKPLQPVTVRLRRSAANGGNGGDGAPPATLAQRIRALQEAARSRKAV